MGSQLPADVHIRLAVAIGICLLAVLSVGRIEVGEVDAIVAFVVGAGYAVGLLTRARSKR